MMMDSRLIFTGQSASQPVNQVIPVTASTSTPSADYLDLGATTQQNQRQIGVGTPLYLVAVNCGTAFVTGTFSVALQSADDTGFSTNLTTHITSGVFAALPAGGAIILQFPLDGIRRYVRVMFIVGATLLSATPGMQAFITDAPQQWIAMADGI